jgi:hypothetical protein
MQRRQVLSEYCRAGDLNTFINYMFNRGEVVPEAFVW